MSKAKKIRVLVCNQYTLFREGIKALFGAEDGIEVAAEAETAKKAVRLVERMHPDVVLLDTLLRDSNGAQAIRRIRAVDPNVKVIMVSMYDDEEQIADCLAAGANGSIHHKEESEQLKNVILMACGRRVRAA